jgi:hypothetical protein
MLTEGVALKETQTLKKFLGSQDMACLRILLSKYEII